MAQTWSRVLSLQAGAKLPGPRTSQIFAAVPAPALPRLHFSGPDKPWLFSERSASDFRTATVPFHAQHARSFPCLPLHQIPISMRLAGGTGWADVLA